MAADSGLKGRIDAAIARLMTNTVREGRARVSVPILYPSGASSAVEIVGNGDKCLVSDIALGYNEAEMYGAQEFYGHCAKNAADRFGVGYDGLCVFAFWAPIDRVEGAIAAVANASVHAATTSIYRAVEEKEKQKNNDLYEKIAGIFGANAVAKTAEVKGRDAIWSAHNIVTLSNHRKAIFEFVGDHTNSISNKFMMFSDLSRLDGAYSLNSVVNNVERIGMKGTMLADVSHVLSITAPLADFKKYAEAA